MDEKQRRIGLVEILFGLTLIFGVMVAVSFISVEEQFGEQKATFILVSLLAFLVSFFSLLIYAIVVKRYRRQPLSIDRALNLWCKHRQKAKVAGSQTSLPAGLLESIVIHSLTRGGYRWITPNVRPTDGYLRFLNRDGLLELVRCIPGPHPVRLDDIIAFLAVYDAEKAVWGEIWAAGGFTDNAIRWVGKRPLSLYGIDDIHKMVERLRERGETSQPGNRKTGA